MQLRAFQKGILLIGYLSLTFHFLITGFPQVIFGLKLFVIFPLYLIWFISVFEFGFSVRSHVICAKIEAKSLLTFLKYVALELQSQNYVAASFKQENSSGFYSAVYKSQ